MSTRSVIPFGPQHPVLPEPIHLDLVMEDEKVVEAIPSIGFIHRGLEKLVDKKDFNEMVYVAERICGICSLGHGLGYSEAVEHIMDIEVPARARYLRTIWSELSRVHSHLLWLGLLADAFGFESLYMESWRLREDALDMFEASTGGRVIFSAMKIGGVRRDVSDEMLRDFAERINKMEEELKVISKPFLNDMAVQTRLRGVGVLTAQQADELGCCGPFLRASGIARDIRSTAYCAYGDVDFEPIISNDGDSYARTECRIKEIFQAFDIIRQCIAKIPGGDIDVPVKGMPNGEYFMRLEQPRGEAHYYVKANGTKFIDRMRVRTPTFANLSGLVETLKGCDLADVPILVLTIDPCISCTER
ncbi:hydrogenase large subunit [Butyrivibrio sp. MC2021]|uniref:hydrogenase large subunit n=1 Tax=Butyrivibrio sp. MC2021 TaxID=1408306 RepID=UPI00047EEFBA|nr:nickel-dependent hydrogenase large subunit [Butyrivibrio sp. MC2021]